MDHQNHYQGVGILGTIIGFVSYVIGHALQFLPKMEEAIPAIILAGLCSFVGALVAVFTKWLTKKFLKDNSAG